MLKNIRLKRIAIITGLLLLIPFIGMQLSNEVNWTLSDFLIMGTVLSVVGLAYELIAAGADKKVYKLAFGIGLAGAFLLFWVNGAVGIIGNEGQDANLLYGTVFIAGFIGSLFSRFKARGMACTLFVVAGIQFVVPIVAMFIWPSSEISWSPGVAGVFLLNSFFVMVFILSGVLFLRAAGKY